MKGLSDPVIPWWFIYNPHIKNPPTPTPKAPNIGSHSEMAVIIYCTLVIAVMVFVAVVTYVLR